jgi:hypothetical protein
MTLALLATITLVLFIGVASFGPIRVRMVLMRASFESWCTVPIFGLVVLALVRL